MARSRATRRSIARGVTRNPIGTRAGRSGGFELIAIPSRPARRAAAAGRGARGPARRRATTRSGGQARPPQQSAPAETASSSPQATILEPGEVDLERAVARRARDRADHLLAGVDPLVEPLQVVEVDGVEVLDEIGGHLSGTELAQPGHRPGEQQDTEIGAV